MNRQQAIDILGQEPNDVIEGFIPEILVFNQLNRQFCEYCSQDWWIGKTPNLKILLLLYKNGEQPSSFEREVAELFQDVNVHVWFVQQDNENFSFTPIDLTKQTITTEALIREYGLHRKKYRVHAKASENTLNNVVRFLEDNNLLLSTAEQRRFANDFMSEFFYGPMNIDIIYKDVNQYCIGDVKCKYPSKDNEYGMNDDIFETLMTISNNFNVYEFVLKKAKGESVFQFFHDNENLVWLRGLIDYNAKKIPRAKKTNFSRSENAENKYVYMIDAKEFIEYAPLTFEGINIHSLRN